MATGAAAVLKSVTMLRNSCSLPPPAMNKASAMEMAPTSTVMQPARLHQLPLRGAGAGAAGGTRPS